MSWLLDLGRLLAFLTRWSRSVRGARLTSGGVILAGAVSGLCNAGLLALINGFLAQPSRRHDAALVWGFAGLCVLLPVSRFASGALLLRLAGRAGFELRMQLARKILAAPLRKLEELGPHRLLATLTQDVPTITNAVVSYPNLFMQVFIVLGCLCYLAWLSWVVLLGVLGFMAVGMLTYQLPVLAANRLMASGREDWDQVARSIRGLIEGTKELKLHQGRRGDFFAGSFEPAAQAMQDKGVASRVLLHAASCWGHVLFFIAIALVLFAWPSLGGADRAVSTGFILLILYMMTPLESILGAIPELSAAAVSVEKIERLGVSLTHEPSGSQPFAQRPAPESWRGLELAGVTHTYRVEGVEESFRLGPIDLRLDPGDLLFLTGGNGSGKTTLAKLLCGLYLPESGEVRLDGVPVTEQNRESFRQHFAAVFSDVFVFESLRGLAPDGVEVDALAAAHLHKLRLDRVVSVRNGKLSRTEVSQGQRKRLALLAAWLEDRPIYLFDEWAADQDVAFKDLFYRQLLPELKARGKTVIVISHDERYYDVADRIVKLDWGRIASAGTLEPAVAASTRQP